MTIPCAPILIVAFNRPAFCAAVLKALRPAKPRHLFLAVDGPRTGHPTDEANCQQIRLMASAPDWPCEIRTYFRDTNRGCKYAPPEAITWFFSHVPAGIILEDDCIPTLDFLDFASELLDRYANSEHVGMITGNNHYGFQTDRSVSYHFSRYASIWGWATWKRAWDLYDVEMTPYLGRLEAIRTSVGHSEKFRNYWWRYVEAVQAGMNTWDVQWAITLLANQKFTVRPTCNLVSNIGFTPNSTHTSFEYDADKYYKTQHLCFPILHPIMVTCDALADQKLERRITSFWRRTLTFIGAKGSIVGRCTVSFASLLETLCQHLKETGQAKRSC